MIETQLICRARNRRSAGAGVRLGPRRGITLIEVLLAGLLSATLMIGLWNLFTTYSRLFETGESKTERAQLVRALMQRLREDLANSSPPEPLTQPVIPTRPAAAGDAQSITGVVLPTTGRTSESGFTSAGFIESERFGLDSERLAIENVAEFPQFGLWGTSQALQLDVLQSVPEGVASQAAPRDSPIARGQAAPSAGFIDATRRVPEFRRIVYRFFEPGSLQAAGRRIASGLLRYENDWESALAAKDDSAGTTVEAVLSRTLPDTGDEEFAHTETETPPPPGALDGGQSGESVVWAPEIVWLEFRYFDGYGWHSEWNSLERRSLPVAVEVAFVLDRTKRGRPGGSRDAGEIEANPPLNAADGFEPTELRLTDIPPEEIHRQLISLPAAPARTLLGSQLAAESEQPMQRADGVFFPVP